MIAALSKSTNINLASEPLKLPITESDIKYTKVSQDLSDQNSWTNMNFVVTVIFSEYFKGKHQLVETSFPFRMNLFTKF